MSTDPKTVDETVQALRDLAVKFDISCVNVNHADISNLLWRSANKIDALQAQLADARNELCQKCGTYKWAHKGACDECRWKEI